MFEIVKTEAASNPVNYKDHESAYDSGIRVFRDADGRVIVVCDEGWILGDCVIYSPKFPEYPVTPLADDEVLQIR